MEDISVPLSSEKIRLTEQLRHCMRERQLAYSTEKTYLYWILNFIRFHNRQHPSQLSAHEVDEYLSYLATKRKVSLHTQSLALNALVFLYYCFFDKELGELNYTRPKFRKKPPVAFTHEEAMTVINLIEHPMHCLMTKLMYGSGLRLMECCRLRVKDIDFGISEIMIRQGKGNRDRHTLLPVSIIQQLQTQIKTVKALHNYDLEMGSGDVWLPYALARKYPKAAGSLFWAYLFPAAKLAADPESGDLRTIQELLGHSDIRTTEIYTHVLNKGGRVVNSPID